MRKTYFFYSLSILLILPISCKKELVSEDISVKACTFNIRFDNENDGFNRWENRRLSLVTFLAIEEPDVIGMQEVLSSQLDYIESRLIDYVKVGVGRDDGIDSGEYAPIFFKRDRFVLEDSGTFWLSGTPEKPSIGWDAAIKRICTWAHLYDNETEKSLHVYNTHFSHVSDDARLHSAELIMDSIAANSSNMSVILTGDLNAEPDSDPYDVIIDAGMLDSYYSKLRFGPEGTYNAFRLTGVFETRIDYIFTQNLIPESYVVNSVVVDNQYLSDHFPVIAVLSYDREK